MCGLSDLLIAISAASAGIVAILGGLIVSKLLSIEGERDVVGKKLSELDGKINLLNDELRSLKNKNLESESLSFILDNIDELISCKSLDHVYKDSEQCAISMLEVQPYWERASLLLEEFLEVSYDKNCEFNSDNIPSRIAEKYKDKNFEYQILKTIVKKIMRNTSKFPLYLNIPEMPNINVFDSISFRENEKRIDEINSTIKIYNYDKQQLIDKKESLKSPTGMKGGLWLMIVFSILCIILPLWLCIFEITSYNIIVILKILFLSLFTLGLCVTFIYIGNLLKWKKK